MWPVHTFKMPVSMTVRPPFSNIAVVHQSFPETVPWLPNKTSVLDSQPNHPLMLTAVCSVTPLSGDKGDLVFKHTASRTVFQDEVSLRTEVPLYFIVLV